MSVRRDELEERINDALGKFRAVLKAEVALIAAKNDAAREMAATDAEAYRIIRLGAAEASALLDIGMAKAKVLYAEKRAYGPGVEYYLTR